MPSYSESALRRLRPQGWQSQTPSVAQLQTARLRLSPLRGCVVVVGGGVEEAEDVEGVEGRLCACSGHCSTSDDSGIREHGLQMRRWRYLRRTGAGGLIVQFCCVYQYLGLQFFKLSSLGTRSGHIFDSLQPYLGHSLLFCHSLLLLDPSQRNTNLQLWHGI